MLEYNEQNRGQGQVVVTDIKMPFWSMTRFMIKWAFASIPALLILIIATLILTIMAKGFILGVMEGVQTHPVQQQPRQ